MAHRHHKNTPAAGTLKSIWIWVVVFAPAFACCLFLLLFGCSMTAPKQPVLFQDPETGLYGFKDPKGGTVVEPQYPAAMEFNGHGIAAVADSKGWTYIDTKGNPVIRPFIYDNGPDYFQEGLARFTRAGKMGFMNQRGRVVIEAKFDFALPFSHGFAPVCMGCRLTKDGEHDRIVNGKWGYINKQGEMVIPPIYDKAAPFKQGNADVTLQGTPLSISSPAPAPYLTGQFHLAVIYGLGSEMRFPLPILPHKPETATLSQQIPFVRHDGIYCAPHGRYLEGLCRFSDMSGATWKIKFSGEPLSDQNQSVFTVVLIQNNSRYLQTDFVFQGKPCDILNMGISPFNIMGLPLEVDRNFSISLGVSGSSSDADK